MRIVFVNLHHNEFLLRPLEKFIFRQSVALKHKYLLDALIADTSIEVCSYINKQGFSLSHGLPRFLARLCNALRFMEHRLVLRKNGINPNKVKVLKRPEEILDDDIVIGYRHVPSTLADFAALPGRKAISMIHFHGEKSDSEAIRASQPHLLFNESDLKLHSEIFRRHYGWYQGPMAVHPFVAADRFQSVKPFGQRECRCFSVGTITYKHHPEFIDIYGDPCDQPMRREMLMRKEELASLIACYNSEYLEGQAMEVVAPGDSRITRMRKAWHNMHLGRQKKYFSFDMVERFNNFKMCLVGEEVLGVPGIGFAEGMACGCAYIGLRGMYEQYGMADGVHYIGYDGTLADLKRVIEHCQRPENQEWLCQIAQNGRAFAEANFRGGPAARRLISSMLASL